MSLLKDELAKLFLAIQFLTRIPIPSAVRYTEQRFSDTPCYYPLVGIVIGLLCAVVYALAVLVFSQSVAIVLVIAFGILLTGAFHEDGLADTFDGIGGGLTKDAALEIMKDSRLGTYGTLSIGLVLATKTAAMLSLDNKTLLAALVSGHCLSRLSSVLVMASSHYVRDHGTGKPVANGINGNSLAIALFTGLLSLAIIGVFTSPAAVLYCVAGLSIGHALMRYFYSRKLGGYTGDTLGAVQQASELGFYLGLAAWI